MKKKMLVALFAVMSVASASAYYIELKNETTSRVSGSFLPRRVRFVLEGNQTKRTTFGKGLSITQIKTLSNRVKPAVFRISKPRIGKNVTITIRTGTRGFVLSES